ncbi:MAG: tRNA (adenosine(37)-N6)-threonylcarbamoyltransferase complex transferase subunit TsaD [Candidatus Ryanbacteria bacterium RIFCSPLOWO2_01_FULL_48_26]|uniref:tRNA N6-adenosine threonylcarbamoyltransferase n=1 Tax=Candidatus Ryanbacteria bacterium RIFCSPLOWO2_01_FULL_48_26 TaxID=1802126 RepID=A0A1G2GSN2_9BACT|nr:MAG: tRNA (adenosine(37)-N6)-threonylcarbamoyltransferase complex transferase subunit TsaD [Candidatus Ryanbacteria bacterium RIFCSPLOWO2_01_FULL_48_26]
MLILAIETSCDETGISLLQAGGGLSKPKFKVIENLVSSQIKIHAPFGGVVPNLAKREHLKNLPILFNKLLKASSLGSKVSAEGGSASGGKSRKLKVDLIAVTVGPGLEPALWTGIEFAKELGKAHGIPVIGANHLEGHLYSFLLPGKQKTVATSDKRQWTRIFPAIALIVSGGHTILLNMKSFSSWKRLGETRDDAAGEAFDKVARLLGLPYPGGPYIEKIALHGNPHAIAFPRPMMRDSSPSGKYNFSFSGLKTSVLYYLKNNLAFNKTDVAASFQEAALDVLVSKTMRAAREYEANSVLLSGGVAANKTLRKRMKDESGKLGLNFFVPDFTYNLDNAAMIGAAGYFALMRKKKYILSARGDLEI